MSRWNILVILWPFVELVEIREEGRIDMAMSSSCQRTFTACVTEAAATPTTKTKTKTTSIPPCQFDELRVSHQQAYMTWIHGRWSHH